MTERELASFIATWTDEAQRTLRVLRALPPGQHDFRPDPQGRSIGELAWHLVEMEAFTVDAVASGTIDFARRLPGLEQPRTVAELASGHERVHAASLAKLRALGAAERERVLHSPMGRDVSVSEVLWMWLLHHVIHHRGQLTLMCRLAGGTPPGIYGPTREEMAAMRARA
jgi:uncharacterized damage-inducible protein DinB